MTDLELARVALRRIGVEHAMTLDERQVAEIISTVFGSLATVARTLAAGIAAVNAGGRRTPKPSDPAALAVLFRAFADILDQGGTEPVADLVRTLGSEVAA